MGNWTNLNSWFNSLDDASDIFNDRQLMERFLKTGSQADSQRKAFNTAINIGTGIHSTKQSIIRLADAMKDIGFGSVKIDGDEKRGYKISFLPTQAEARNAISKENIPSLEILPNDKTGLTVNNNLPAVDALFLVQNQGKEVGLASARAISIDAAAREMIERAAWIQRQTQDYNKKAKEISRYLKQSMRAVTHESPSASTKTQREAFMKATTINNVKGLRREAVSSMAAQAHTSWLLKTMVQNYKNKFGKYGAPRDEGAFAAEFQNLLFEAGGYSSLADFAKNVKNRHPWIYKNVWKNDLEKTFGLLFDVGIVQGGKKEGTPGLVSFQQPPVPAAFLAGKTDRKIKANIQSFVKEIDKETQKALSSYNSSVKNKINKGLGGKYSSLTTKEQRKLYPNGASGEHISRSYLAANISDKDIAWAGEQLLKNQYKQKFGQAVRGTLTKEKFDKLYGASSKGERKELDRIRADMLKGVQADASVYARSIANDFLISTKYYKEISGEVLEDEIKKLAAKSIEHTQEYKNESTRAQAIEKAIRGRRQEFESSVIRSFFNLKNNSSFTTRAGVSPGTVGIDIVEKLRNKTFTARGGTMSDFRSVTSDISPDILRLAAQHAGYSKQDAARITVGRGEHKIKSRDTLLGMLNSTIGEYQRRGYSNEKILKAFAPLNGVLGFVPGYGFDFDDVALEKLIKSSGGLTEVLMLMGGIMADAYKLKGGNALKKEKDSKGTEVLQWAERILPLAQGIETSSVDRYQGMGPGAAKKKYDLNDLNVFSRSIENIGKLFPGVDLTPWRAAEGRIRSQLQTQIDDYQRRYVNNTQKSLKATFNSNEVSSRRGAEEAGLLVNVQELLPYGLNGDLMEWDTESGRGGIHISKESGTTALEELRNMQEAEFKRNSEKYKKQGVFSAEEVPVSIYATDSRGNIIPFIGTDSAGGKHLGYHARLGVGNIGERYSIGDNQYFSIDELAQENFNIIRAIAGLTEFGWDTMDAEGQRRAQESAGRSVQNAITRSLDAMDPNKKGSIFEKYHTLKEKSGGYMLAQAMNTETLDQLSGLYGFNAKDLPSLALNPADAEKLLFDLTPDQLKSQYKLLYGKEADEPLDKKGIVNAIKRAINPMAKGYRGGISREFLMMRYPLLKFYDAALSAGAIVLEAVEEGNMLVSPDLAAAFKGDFDGDRWPVYNAALEGDLTGLASATTEYYNNLIKRQAQVRKQEEGSSPWILGATKDLEAPLNETQQNLEMLYKNLGQQWAGRSGDLLKKMLAEFGKSADVDPNVLQLINLIGQAYQTGINVKNITTERLKGRNPADLLDSLFYQVRQSGTWDTEQGLNTLFDTMQALGIVGEEGKPLFESHVIADMGWGDQFNKDFIEGLNGLDRKSVIQAILDLSSSRRRSGQTSVGHTAQNLYANSPINNRPDSIFSDMAFAPSTGKLATAGKILEAGARFTTATEAKKAPLLGKWKSEKWKSYLHPQSRSHFFEKLAELDISDEAKREEFINRYKDEFAGSASMFGGTVAHAFAESFASGGRIKTPSAEEQQEILNTYAKLYALGALTLDPTIAEIRGLKPDALGQFDAMDVARTEMAGQMLVGTALAAEMTKNAGESGQFFTETPVPGVAFGATESAIADLISVFTDEKGKTHFRVTDYKTSGSTELRPDYLLQVLSEIENLKLLEQAIKVSGAPSGEDFVRSFASSHGYKGEKGHALSVAKQWAEKYKGNEGQLINLINAMMRGENVFEGRIGVADRAGRFKTYAPNLFAKNTAQLAQSFIGEEVPDLSQEQIDAILAESILLGDESLSVPVNQESLVANRAKEYRKLLGEKEKYSVKKSTLLAKQQSSALSPEERSALSEELETVDSYLVNHINVRLNELLDFISKNEATSPEFIAQLKQEGLSVDKRIAVSGDMALRQAKLDEYKRIRSDRQTAYSAYKDLYGYESRIGSVDAALAKETNQDKRDILEQEKADLEELRNIAQETVDLLAEAHKNDPNWTGAGGYLATGQRRARLDTRVRERAERAQAADGGLLGDISGQFSSYFSRFVVGRGAMTIMAKLRQGIKLLVQNAKALDGTLTNLRIVTNGTKEDTRRLMTEYSNLGQKIGATTQEVSASALEWQRQGYQTAQIQDLVTASLYLSKLGMIDATAATKDLTSALKGFKMQASESMDIVDKLTAIDLKAATSAGDIAEGLAQFANIGSLAGVDMDQAAAYVATIADVTQASGTQVGTSMKTIISRYGNVKAGAYNKMNLASAEEGDVVNDVEKVLNKIGISIRSSSLTFKDFDEVLAEVAEKWDALDNVSKKAIATALAGIRQQESVVTLLSNWTKYEELLEVSRNSRGTAETKYTAYQESYQAAQKRLTAAVENIASNSGVAGLLTEGINLLAEIVDALPKILKWMPGLIAGMSNYRALSGQSWLQKGLKGLEEKGRLRSLRSFFIGDKRRDATDAYVAVGGERVFKSAKEFEKAAENTAKSAQETQAAMEETGEQITFDSVLEEQHKENTARLGAQETQEEEKQLALKQQGGEGASGGSLWASKGALLATMAINQTMAGASAYMTGGQTHTDSRGNTVTSSEEAKSVSRSVDAALSAAIPFVGGFLGDLVGSWVAQSIDKIRDDIHNLSADAQETTNVLEHISSQVSEIKNLSTLKSIDDIRRADALADEFLSDIYKSENDSTRKVFKEELGKINNGDDDLYKLVQSFKNEVGEGRRDAARKLEIAQVKALHQQEKIARTEDIYNQEQKVGNAQLKYNSALDGFTDLGITNRESAMAWGGGTAAGIGTAGALATTGAILLAAWPGLLGKLIGGALLGGSLVAGFGAGSAVGSAITNNYKQQRAQEWERSLVSDKLTILSEQAELMKRVIETGNDQAREDAQQQLAATEEMTRALKDYQQYMWTLRDEDNKMLVEEALLTAQTMSAGRNAYLTDLNVVELKRLGVGKIYRTLAEEVEKSGGLAGYSMRYENGDLSEGFLKYAERVLKTDEEIAAVLSGEAYKLKEALEKLNPRDQFDKKILESFASAIGTTVSNLPQFIDKLGELTLADLLKSTQELIDSTSAFSSLLNTMASSTESISGWMNKIVQQYPDLIAYMSDTPRVMQEIMTQLRQLNNQELKEQWNQYAASGEYYDKVFKPGIFSYVASLRKKQKTELTDADIDNALQQSGATTMASLLKYLMGTDTSKEINKVLIEAFQHASGDTLVADLYREQLKNATEFIANAYQKQVDALTEQRNMLENINKQREYELKLLKARVRLEEAMNDKRRIYRAGVGWVYEADQNKIAEAQKEIEDLSVEKQISKIDKQISAIAYIADKWKTLWDVRTEEQKQELTEVFFGEFSSNGRGAVQAIVEGFSEDFNNTLTDGGGTAASLLSQAVFLLDGIEVGVDKISEQVVEASLADREQTLADLTNAWENYTKLLSKNKTASELNSALEEYQRIYSIAESRGYIGSDFHQSAGTGVDSREALKAATQDMYTPKYSYSVNTPSGSQSYVTDYSSAQKSIVSEILDPDKNIRFMQDPSNKKSGNWSDAKAGTWGSSFAQFISKAYGEDIGLYESAEDLAAFLQERGVEDLLFQLGDGRSALYHDGAFYALSKSSEESSQSSVVWGHEMGINTTSPSWINATLQSYMSSVGVTTQSNLQKRLKNFRSTAAGGILGSSDWQNAINLDTFALWLMGGSGLSKSLNTFYNNFDNYLRQTIAQENSSSFWDKTEAPQIRPEGTSSSNSGSGKGSLSGGNVVRNALGTTNFAGATALLNEFGTEAIVTPSGTLTALPAHSGILPADITSNLWALGEIAPNLLRAVEGGISLRNGVSGSAPLCDESFNINNLTMNVSADSSFDADAFVKSIKARVALTKNLT